MAFLSMYPPQANTPITTLAGALTAGQTTITVADASILPAAPNLLVIGADTVSPETILLTQVNTSNNTITVTRGVEGSASSWPAGSLIGRFFTAQDLSAVQNNITELQNGKADKQPRALPGELAALGTDGALEGSGCSPDSFAPSGHNHDSTYEPLGVITTHNDAPTAHDSLFAAKADRSTKTGVNIAANSWNTSGTYPTVVLTCPGCTSSNIVEICPAATISKAALEAYQAANLFCIVQSADAVTLAVYGDLPTVTLPLTLIVRGDL